MSHTAISIDQDQLAAKEIIQPLYWESVEAARTWKEKLISENVFFFFFFFVVVYQMTPCMYIANRIIFSTIDFKTTDTLCSDIFSE